jgi:hypothetical protein
MNGDGVGALLLDRNPVRSAVRTFASRERSVSERDDSSAPRVYGRFSRYAYHGLRLEVALQAGGHWFESSTAHRWKGLERASLYRSPVSPAPAAARSARRNVSADAGTSQRSARSPSGAPTSPRSFTRLSTMSLIHAASESRPRASRGGDAASASTNGARPSPTEPQAPGVLPAGPRAVAPRLLPCRPNVPSRRDSRS